MKRSNSWKNIQKTFAAYSSSTPVRKPKRIRSVEKVVPLNDDEYHIEDSDEENQAQNTTTNQPVSAKKLHTADVQTPARQKQRRSIKPLSITVLNASTAASDAAVACDEDSNDHLVEDDEANLLDVSTKKTTNYRHRSKASRNSLNISTTKDTTNNRSAAAAYTTTTSNQNEKNLNDSIKDRLSSFHSVFNGLANKCTNKSDDENIVCESDTDESADADRKTSIPSRKMSYTISVDPSDRNSPKIQIESESTQSSLKLASQIHSPYMRTTTKSKKCIKDGFVEQLNKITNQSKSDCSFWLNDRLADLIEAGEEVTIDQMEHCYGRILLHCSNASHEKMIICLDAEDRKFSTLKIGRRIEVLLDSAGYQLKENLVFYPYVNKILR